MKQIGDIILENKYATIEQIKNAMEVQNKEGGLLGLIMVDMKYITENQLLDCLKKQLQQNDDR